MHEKAWTISLPLFLLLAGCGSSSSSNASAGDAGVGDDGSAIDSGGTGDDDASTGSDGSTQTEAGVFTPGTPITATAGQWTWVPFADSSCGNGTPTGIGVNLSSTGTRVLIYLEGGGACWSAETCYALQTAANFSSGYSAADFQTESTDTTYLAAPGGFFDRTAAANPFKDYSYVYVPYCTGDIHGGTVVTQLGTNTAHFVGYNNFTSFLDRIVPTFPTVDRVVIAGSSGGGYGAVLNALQTQSAFGSVRVDVLDDSGTFMPTDVNAEGNGNISLAMTAWNLASIAPADCTTCVSDPSTLYGYFATKFPTHRAGLLSYTQDSVLPSYYGITTAQFTTGLDEDLTQQFAPNANLKAFVVGAAGHVLFFDPTLTTNNVTLQTWVTQMVTDDPTWATEQPAAQP
jgi:hypothetical protein